MNPIATVATMDTAAVVTLPEDDMILHAAAKKDIIEATSAAKVGAINVSN